MEPSNLLMISCPSCAHQFSPGVAMEKQVRAALQMEYEAQLKEKELSISQSAKAEVQRQFEEEVKNKSTLIASLQKNAEEQRLKFDLQLSDMKIAIEQAALKNAESAVADRLSKMEQEAREKSSKVLELQAKANELERSKEDFEEQTRLAKIQFENELHQERKRIREEEVFKAKQLADLEMNNRVNQVLQEKQSLEVSMLNRMNEEIQKVRHQESLKQSELSKKLEDQTALINEMKRKTEQGSMQLQGEVLELELEKFLFTTYPLDVITPVAKGASGADCIQTVKSKEGYRCGKIIYETKRTKHFAWEWIDKLKSDLRASESDVAILVTEALPKDMIRFGFVDGIWVCTPLEVRSVSLIMRETMLQIGEINASHQDKGTKMETLYNYMTGIDFRNNIQAIVESITEMTEDLKKEKNVYQKIWAQREKQLEKSLHSSVKLIGTIKGIAGSAVKEISGLELESLLHG